jgi:hypothetical protein
MWECAYGNVRVGIHDNSNVYSQHRCNDGWSYLVKPVLYCAEWKESLLDQDTSDPPPSRKTKEQQL